MSATSPSGQFIEVDPIPQRSANGGISFRKVYECADADDPGIKVQVREYWGGAWGWSVIGRVSTLDSGQRPRKKQAFKAGLAALATWKLRLNQQPSDENRRSSSTDSGAVEISDRELITSGARCSCTQSLILSIASAKGCPVDGIIDRKLHSDYDYRITNHHDGRMTIKWNRRQMNDASNPTQQ